jgi:antitoxin HicB
LIKAAKCALYLAMKRGRYTNVFLAKQLRCDEKEVRRLLDPRYQSKISRIEEALHILGNQLTLSVTPRF